jgi:hypothetical protein
MRKYGPMTEEHRKAISEGMRKGSARRRNEEEKDESSTKATTITLPNNPHRITRVVELGTMLDNMFPKTKIKQIREILHSVRRILERGA